MRNVNEAILQCWRTNCRTSVSALSRALDVSTSYVWSRWKKQEILLTPRFTTLIDPTNYNHPLRIWIFMKRPPRSRHSGKRIILEDCHETLRVREILEKNWHVNTAFRTLNGYCAEVFLRDKKELKMLLKLLGETVSVRSYRANVLKEHAFLGEKFNEDKEVANMRLEKV